MLEYITVSSWAPSVLNLLVRYTGIKTRRNDPFANGIAYISKDIDLIIGSVKLQYAHDAFQD